MATALSTPTRQAFRVPAASGVDPAARVTPTPAVTTTPTVHPGLLARTGKIAAFTVRGIGVFAVTGAKVLILGKHGVD